jgi:hypothetical protein
MPSVVALAACESAVPKGCCRFTQVRRMVSLCSKEWLIDPLWPGSGNGHGSRINEVRKLQAVRRNDSRLQCGLGRHGQHGTAGAAQHPFGDAAEE